ncbi:MAG: glutamyl-tRNA reductase [Pyrinomonadaceae bacterium]
MGYNSTNNHEAVGLFVAGQQEELSASMVQPKTLFAFGINHKTAPVEIREKLHLREDEIASFLAELRTSLAECVVLSTCNRTEIYGVSESRKIDLNHYKDILIDFKDARGLVRDKHFFALTSCPATQQLFNVATSIDSRVIGDSQILRQLRTAYDIAIQNGFTGKILNQLMQRAFKLGKMTYTETSIHDGAVSVSLAAVELGVQTFGSLRGRTALVIGAGEMARFTAAALVNKRVGKILVSNRTRAHAEELASKLNDDSAFECEVVDFESIKNRLREADIIVSATGSDEPILHVNDFAGIEQKALVVDIAVPRDIDTDVGKLPNVILRNVDDLRTIIDAHHERRVKDLPKVRTMIGDEMVEFLTWYYTLPIMPEYQKTGAKPSAELTGEILRIKQFFNQNLSEIHRLAAKSGGDFYEDLNSHFELIDKLQTLKAQTFASALA